MSEDYSMQPPTLNSAKNETFQLTYATSPSYAVVCTGTLDLSPLGPDQTAYVLINMRDTEGNNIGPAAPLPQPVGNDGAWQFSIPVVAPAPEGSFAWAVAWLVSPEGQTAGSSYNGTVIIQ